MKRVIIVGSPRSNGRSAHIAEMLFEANIDERPEDELFLVPLSEIEVGPCIGCNACRKQTEVAFTDDNGVERSELRPRCVFDDDMQTLYDLLDETDELTVVSPVYFSGAPALMKCMLDRMQPYFWAETRKRPKRPATLHVLGEGGDPHGFSPLISEVKSSLACAGFQLDCVFDWVGKVDENGEITAEADVIAIAGTPLKQQGQGSQAQVSEDQDRSAPRRKEQGRPKLDLSSGQKKPSSGARKGQASPSKGKPNSTSQKRKGSAGRSKGVRRG